jgi:circadian clock protein KaiC
MMSTDFVRIESGIPGLDEMLEGGFPFPSTILIAGHPGTGKTTFALQFLFDGAKRGEQGLYFTTFSEPTQWMLRFTSRYSFVNKDYLGKEIKYLDLSTTIKRQPHKLLDFIEDKIAEIMPQRIVIDPISVVDNLLNLNYREFLYDLSASLKNWQAVTILTGESKPMEDYPLEIAYTADGVIILYNIEYEDGRRKFLEILKMRGSDHTTGKHAVDLSSNGFSVQAGLR